MSSRNAVLIVSAVVFVAGLIGWIASGDLGFRYVALIGIFGLAIAFIFGRGPQGMYGRVSDGVRRGRVSDAVRHGEDRGDTP